MAEAPPEEVDPAVAAALVDPAAGPPPQFFAALAREADRLALAQRSIDYMAPRIEAWSSSTDAGSRALGEALAECLGCTRAVRCSECEVSPANRVRAWAESSNRGQR